MKTKNKKITKYHQKITIRQKTTNFDIQACYDNIARSCDITVVYAVKELKRR